MFSAVLSTIAPDQEDQVFEALLRSSGHEIQEKKNRMLRKMFSATKFQFCLNLTTNLKVVILDYKLSLFARHFSKQELRGMIPGLSKWQIDRAWRHAAKGPGHQVVPTPIKRIRLDPVKTSHFVNFIARPNFLQDVAMAPRN